MNEKYDVNESYDDCEKENEKNVEVNVVHVKSLLLNQVDRGITCWSALKPRLGSNPAWWLKGPQRPRVVDLNM